MKIVFLDIDGVLCTPRVNVAYKSVGVYAMLDPVSCFLLLDICKETGAKIVITSTWRKHHDRFSIEAILNAVCPNLGGHVYHSDDDWRTKSMPGVRRGEEIQEWLDRNTVDAYVILDDDSDMLESQMPWFIKTDYYDGIGLKHYIKSLEYLSVSELDLSEE